MIWKAGAIFKVIKYLSVVAVIGFLTYSVISSYTLRETIGELKAELRIAEENIQVALNRAHQNEQRLTTLRMDRAAIWREIDDLSDEEEDQIFWDNIFERLYGIGRENN